MGKPKIISIVGLTASGKSSLGIVLARMFNGEIISADSRQVYKGVDLNSGKITAEEQAMVVHHLLDVVCPVEYSRENKFFDVFAFQKMAYEKIDEILARGKVPIIVGGTGLYSRAVIEGYTFNTESTHGRQNAAPTTRSNNISHFCRGGILPPVTSSARYDVLQIALMPSKEWLIPRIEQRIDIRLKEGMLEETKALLASGVRADWLKLLGLDCEWNTKLALDEVSFEEYRYWYGVRTAQFAKRQRTWFKKEKNTVFLENPEEFELESINRVKEFLGL